MPFQNPITRLSQLIADSITGGVITGTKIYGSLFSTAANATDKSAHWELSGSARNDTLTAYSGLAVETSPANIGIIVDPSTNQITLVLYGADTTHSAGPSVEMITKDGSTSQLLISTGDFNVDDGAGGGIDVQSGRVNIGGPNALTLDGPIGFGSTVASVDIAGATGWGMDSRPNVLQVLGKLFVVANIQAHNASQLSFSSVQGAIADQLICTVPAGYRPGKSWKFSGLWNGRGCSVRVDPGGGVNIEAVDGYGTGPTYPAGSEFLFQGMWLIGW